MSSITSTEVRQQGAERVVSDLLIGAQAIADALGVTKRAVYHLAQLEDQRLPIGRIGRNLIASRSELRRKALELIHKPRPPRKPRPKRPRVGKARNRGSQAAARDTS